MRWIGQHIWDFISRFRSDVYLEAIESGTIASGGNLGLDSNNKIVKADTEAGELSITNASDNRVVTSSGGTDLNAEANLTYSGTALSVNALTSTFTNTTNSQVIVKNNGDNTAGGIVDIINERGTGVDGDEAGIIRFYSDDDGGNSTLVANVVANIPETANGSEKGSIITAIKTASGSTMRNAVTGSSSASDVVDVDIGFGATSTTTIAGNLTTNGESVLFTSSTTQKPVVEIRNTTSDGNGPELKFNNTNAGGDASDGDFAGKITFNAMDDGTPTETTYASIYSRIDDATSTEESGNLYLSVANHDGGLGVGVKLTGGSVNDEVDVEIGKGGASVTNIVGDLTIAGRTRRTLKITDGAAAGEYDGDVVYTGTTTGMTTGACYYYTNAGQWALTNASSTGSSTGLLAIALGDESDVDGMLLRGMVTTTAVAGTPDEGAIVYLRASNGAITTDQASSGQVNRIVGYCMENSNNRIYFDPDKSWVELA